MSLSAALRMQAMLALASLPWLACYWAAFRFGKGHVSRRADLLYNSGVFANLTWVAMALAPQPRFPGLLSLDTVTWANSLPLMLGAALIARFTALNVAAMHQNSNAVQRQYAQPQRLLTEGAYARVRNPMNAGGMLIWLGLCLVTGASLTILLFPLYLAVNHTFTAIEEKMALVPAFGEAFASYRSRVPSYFDRAHLAWLLGVLLAVGGQWLCSSPV